MPLATWIESQLNPKGEAVSLATVRPLTCRSMRVTPLLSLDVTLTATRPATVLEPSGAVIEAVGGCESTLDVAAFAAATAACALTRPQPYSASRPAAPRSVALE